MLHVIGTNLNQECITSTDIENISMVIVRTSEVTVTLASLLVHYSELKLYLISRLKRALLFKAYFLGFKT
jgi:hypothetical protein